MMAKADAPIPAKRGILKGASRETERKIRVVRRVMLWTTIINILIFLAVIAAAYILMRAVE